MKADTEGSRSQSTRVKRTTSRVGKLLTLVGQDRVRKVLTLHSRLRGEILPVFGSEEDAGMFLTPLGAFGGGLTPRPIAAEDLASLLWGPLSSVGTVALDPTPGVDTAAVLDLISTDRESFVEYLSNERATAGARPLSGGRPICSNWRVLRAGPASPQTGSSTCSTTRWSPR